MYVQRGTVGLTAAAGPRWEQKNKKDALPEKMKAKDLLPQDCECDGPSCEHSRAVISMQVAAPGGIEVSTEAEAELARELQTQLGIEGNDKIDAFIELYGFWLGDGTLRSERNERCSGVDFALVKVHDNEWIEATLKLLGVVYTVYDDREQNVISVCDPRWCDYFNSEYRALHLDDYAKNGKWYWMWVYKSLNRDRLRLLLEGTSPC